MTYNVLAQCLIKRELFPYTAKNDLRSKPRLAKVVAEITKTRQPDIACLQEVDFFDDVYAPQFRSAGYDWVYMKKNPNKTIGHGLCIIWKRDKFIRHTYREIKFDDHQLTHPTNISPATGNIGQILALTFIPADKSPDDTGIILTNHHLYWHYDALFQKLRQCYVMLEEATSFRKSLVESTSNVSAESKSGYDSRVWPLLVCGDFNVSPNEGPYAILTRHPSLMDDEDIISAMDPARWLEKYPVETETKTSNSSDQSDQPSQITPTSEIDSQSKVEVISPVTPADLIARLKSLPRLQSAYGNYRDLDKEHTINPNWISTTPPPTSTTTDAGTDARAGNGPPVVNERWKGEPLYTTFVAALKGTLDYIFLAVPDQTQATSERQDRLLQPSPRFTKILEIPQVDQVLPGLPNTHYGSDHVCLMAEMEVAISSSS
ncbi:hypothetical protein HK102_006598 [Quaeritorhiza haematococci]|nr:hypothetical protein HK102_006598 [Quaeritorhiza haematococci]